MREREAQRVRRARRRIRRARRRASRQRGFTITQLVITIAVVAIAASFAIMGIASARTSMRVQHSAREFAGYVEKVRSDAIRRHATASVQIASANATSFVVTMDFNLDGVPETRTIALQTDVTINHDPVTLTFDWRGRLTGAGLSLTFEGPNGRYPVQLDVTGSGDVTIGEEKFLDEEVPAVTLNNIIAGTVDTLGSIGTAPPAPPPSSPPPTDPSAPPSPPPTDPGTPPSPPTDPGTPPSPPTDPGTPPSPPTDPGTPPSPPTDPGTPPGAPPSPPPTTPPSTPTCSMTVSETSLTINACNSQGNGCGSKTVRVTMTNAGAGATVSATQVPSNLTVTLTNQANGVFTFSVASNNQTRTTNSVEFTGLACGTPQTVSVTTK